MEGRVFLKSVTVDGSAHQPVEKVVAIYRVKHTSEEAGTTLEQSLILTKENGRWTASMSMDDSPSQKTVTASAWKLADLMERMAAAIKDNTFETIDLNGL